MPSFPGTFQLDALLGTLPQVSWILAPLLASEHPPAPVEFGEAISAQVVSALTANPAVWAKTAPFITHDENGGFFDHVRPPTPPPGTPGEWLTVSPLPADAGGVTGPVGLGFRVPMSSCATSAPLSLLTDVATSLRSLEATLVAPYPVPRPPQTQPAQEPGAARRPSGPVACAI